MLTKRLNNYFNEAQKHIDLEEIDEMVESINLFIKKSSSLVEISQRLEQKYHEIKRKRDSRH